jgi:hypothetical protein
VIVADAGVSPKAVPVAEIIVGLTVAPPSLTARIVTCGRFFAPTTLKLVKAKTLAARTHTLKNTKAKREG